jgi:hypothetical protein
MRTHSGVSAATIVHLRVYRQQRASAGPLAAPTRVASGPAWDEEVGILVGELFEMVQEEVTDLCELAVEEAEELVRLG